MYEKAPEFVINKIRMGLSCTEPGNIAIPPALATGTEGYQADAHSRLPAFNYRTEQMSRAQATEAARRAERWTEIKAFPSAQSEDTLRSAQLN